MSAWARCRQVVADLNGWFVGGAPWVAIGACLVIRFLAVRYAWGLPIPK